MKHKPSILVGVALALIATTAAANLALAQTMVCKTTTVTTTTKYYFSDGSYAIHTKSESVTTCTPLNES